MTKALGLWLAALLLFGLSACASREAGSGKTIRVSADSANAAEPATASLPDGKVAVAWVEHQPKTADVMLQIFDQQGNAATQPLRVNTTAGEAKAWRGDPPVIAAAPDGTIYVSWTAAIPDNLGTILYVSASRDGGRSFEPAVKVNDDAVPASHGMHSLAVDNGGHVYIAWLDERYLVAVRQPEMHHASTDDAPEPNAELYFAESDDGARSFSLNRRIAVDACPCCKTSIAADDDGHLFVGFRTVLPGGFRHIAVVPSSSSGRTFGQPVVVANDSWQINACPVSGPSMEIEGDALEVVWFAGGDARPKGVYWTLSRDLKDLAFSGPKLVGETASAGTPALAGSRAVWTELNDLKTAHVAEAGSENILDLGPGSVPALAKTQSHTYLAFAQGEPAHSAIMFSILPK